ncbi:PAS domain S-box protein [Mucilaginibacter sp.]
MEGSVGVNLKTDACFEVLFYANPQPMWVVEIKSLQIVEVNEAAVRQYGYTRQEFLSKSIVNLYHKNDVPALLEMIKRRPAELVHFDGCHHLAKDGTLFTVNTNAYHTEYKGMQCYLVQALSTEHSRLVDLLASSQQKFNHLVHHSPIGFCQLNNRWQIMEWNAAAEHLIGYQSTDVIGKKLWAVLPELLHTEFYANCIEAMQRQANVEFTTYYWPLQNWFAVALYPNEGGLILQLRNITRKKMFEEALLYKLQQLKQISFFNSHFIRKPVASLIGVTQLVTEGTADSCEFRRIAGYINECGTELDEMLKRINQMLQNNEGIKLVNKLNSFDFNKLVTVVIEAMQIKYPCVQVNAVHPHQLHYYGNEKAIQSAITNLVDNAVKFSGGHKPVNIKADVINHNIVVSIQDYGIGMSDNQLADFFEIYNKDKVTLAVGTGLLNVFNVIKKHYGNFWIESQVNVGTVFNICFPLSNVPAYRLHGSQKFAVYKQPQFKINYQKQQQCLYTSWTGFHNANSVKACCMHITSAIHQTGAQMLLIDHSGVLGVWEGAVRWIIYEWHPKLVQAGVTHIAAVYSPCTFSNFSAKHILRQSKSKICIRLFNTRAEAIAWLNQQRTLPESNFC